MSDPFSYGEFDEHTVVGPRDRRKCGFCYPTGYPKRCGCRGGMLHAEERATVQGSEYERWQVLRLKVRCDRCGREYADYELEVLDATESYTAEGERGGWA